MIKSEIWQVTATLTIPTEPDGQIKAVVGAVSSQLQADLEEFRDDMLRLDGVTIEIGVSSCKTGELSEA